MKKYTLISFYADVDDGDYYTRHAKRLIENCKHLDIPLHIEELPSEGDYRLNCLKKTKFILDKWNEIDVPIVWMDVDSLIHTNLDFYEKALTSFDIIYTSPFSQGASPPNAFLAMKASPIGFSKEKQTKRFIEAWIEDCESEKSKQDNLFDHECLLSITIPRMHNSGVRWGGIDDRFCTWPGRTNPSTIITMGIADGESKKKNLEKMGLDDNLINMQLIGDRYITPNIEVS